MPVSFHGDVAPILAMHCNSCHGEAGGLSTRSHAALLAGGNKGKLIEPGNAEASLLVHYIDGRRGRSQTMPLGAEKLRPEQIETIRRWIEEGARADDPRPPATTESKTFRMRKQFDIACRAQPGAYLLLKITGGAAVLFERVAPRPTGGEERWTVHTEPRWPEEVTVSVESHYAPSSCKIEAQ
jgi:hypothetical protein